MSNEWIWILYNIDLKENHNQKLPCDSGGATRIGYSVRGGHETGGAGDFPSYLHLYNLKFFWWMQLQ